MIDIHVLTYSGTRQDWLDQCLASLATEPCTVHVVPGVEGNVGAGRAVGYTLGEHEFVGYVDSDDYVFPGVMRACLDGLKAHRGVVTMERQLWGSLLSARRYEGHHLTIYRREDVLPLLSVLPEHPYLCDRYVAGMLSPTQLPVDGYVWRRHVWQGHRNADEAQARNLKEALSCG